MVTATKSNRAVRRDAALDNLRGDMLQGMLTVLAYGNRVTSEQLRLLYSEIRAAHGSPDCMPVDYTDAVVRDSQGNPTQQRMNPSMLKKVAKLLLLKDGCTDSSPVLHIGRGQLICMVLTVHEQYLLD